MAKRGTIFSILNNLTKFKVPWENLSKEDKKVFNIFMLNRWLSMHPPYIPIVNIVQEYSFYEMSDRDLYNFYFDILPPISIRFNYISKDRSGGSPVDKYDKYIEFIANKENMDSRDVEYFMYNVLDDPSDIEEYLPKYGIHQG